MADAELIVESFNTCYETGKTPRELADENTELREAVRMMVNIATHPRATKEKIHHIANDCQKFITPVTP